MNRLYCTTLAAGIFLSVNSAKAAVVVQYGFENSSTPFAPSSVLAGAIAGDISRNTGTTLGTNTGSTGFVHSLTGSPAGTGNLAIQFMNIDDVAAPTDGSAAPDNITFTLTPAVAGTALNLDSLTFLTRLNTETTGLGGVFTIQYDDLSDPAGFQLLSPTFSETGSTVQTRTIDLSSALFDNLTSGITFRINFNEPSPTNTGSNSMKVDNITVNGAVIPEPASAALALGGGLFLLARRRRDPAV